MQRRCGDVDRTRRRQTSSLWSASPSKRSVAQKQGQRPFNVFRMRSNCLLGARLLAWAVLSTAMAVFWSITFVRPTGWYRDDTGGHFKAVWQKLQLNSSTTDQGRNVPIMPGIVSTQVKPAAQAASFTCNMHAYGYTVIQ